MKTQLLLYPAPVVLLITDSESNSRKRKKIERKIEYEKQRLKKIKKSTDKIRLWRIKNPEREKQNQLKYYEKNKDKLLSYAKQWRLENPEEMKERCKKWRIENPKKSKETVRKYRNTPKGKEINKKHNTLRARNLGSILINDWFIGCNRHHINSQDIICIPSEIHKQHPHNHKRPETMIEINRIAFEYLTENIRQI